MSSTLGELAQERRVVARAVSALRLTPVMFELGARPHAPQDLYRAYLAQSDIFIGLYWQSYGQVADGAQVSGLEQEFDLSGRLPRLLYVKVPAPDREPRLTDLLARIREQASYRKFGTPGELAGLVRDDLAILLSERFVETVPGERALSPRPGPSSARPFPTSATSLVGRDQTVDEVADLVGQPGVRLVTLTGPGGIGKTRLAMAVGERLRDDFAAGTVFVPLANVTEPELVWVGIGRAVGADLSGTNAARRALVEQLSDGEWLLILDNLEQAVEVARDLDELLARCPAVAIIATSRTVLHIRAEQEYEVPPLSVPAEPAKASPEEVASWPAVALFVDRARTVNRDFVLTDANASAVAAICRRLEGIPLAIELAAARTRLLDPDELLRRLTNSLDALGTGPVDLPERQQTLRATVAWSVALLDGPERSMLDTAAVFADGWTIDAAAHVAGLDEDQSLDLMERLARHSLVKLDRTGLGPRARMLETVHTYIAERLENRPDVGEIRRRHANYYLALTEEADIRLRGIGHIEWLERLQIEEGNLAAAVRWSLANDISPLPHLFRVLWSFWFLREHMGQAREWVNQTMPAVDSLDDEARAELLWTGQVSALEVGDDAAAVAAGERLGPLLPGIQDPFLRAAARLARAWTLPIVGGIEEALLEASASLDQFHAQDEPFWTTLALGSLGTVESNAGRNDDAVAHLSEARDLADRYGHPWLAAWSRTLLGSMAIAAGRLDEARALLEEALGLSLAARSTNGVTLCLIAYARLALADGIPERAAQLAGAAEGLRGRAGLRVWPTLRPGEAELVAQLHEVLAHQFDKEYAIGAQLNQQEAIATIPDKRGKENAPTTTHRS